MKASGMQRDIVLVVDDSPGSLGMVTDSLEATGVTVLVALDGRSALDILGRITPDVILVDAVMPGMDGFETCRQIKAIPSLDHVPVIFMTGLTDTHHVLEGLSAGGVDYLTKPIVPDILVARMRVHLANARQGQTARTALDVAGRHYVAATKSGRIVWSTPEAARLLRSAGGLEGELPPSTRTMLSTAGSGAASPGVHAIAGGIGIGVVGMLRGGEILLRITTDRTEDDREKLRCTFGLTQREAEVLSWLVHGKTNRDIAEILNVSPRTVDKHLEQIYHKVGVENRAAAAAVAVRLVTV